LSARRIAAPVPCPEQGRYTQSRDDGTYGPRAWNGSWTGAPDNPSAVSAISAIIRGICAASGRGAGGRTSHNPPVVGSRPHPPHRWRTLLPSALITGIFYGGLGVFSKFYFSETIISDSKTYVTIGAIFGIMTWFIAIGAVIILGAVAGAVWEDRRN
jgi:hypothetical protein